MTVLISSNRWCAQRLAGIVGSFALLGRPHSWALDWRTPGALPRAAGIHDAGLSDFRGGLACFDRRTHRASSRGANDRSDWIWLWPDLSEHDCGRRDALSFRSRTDDVNRRRRRCTWRNIRPMDHGSRNRGGKSSRCDGIRARHHGSDGIDLSCRTSHPPPVVAGGRCADSTFRLTCSRHPSSHLRSA